MGTQRCQVIVSPTVYPRVVVNYNFSLFFPLKVDSQESQSLGHSRGSPDLHQNLMQIGPGVPELWSENKQTEITALYKLGNDK